jgi:hypothetical protein
MDLIILIVTIHQVLDDRIGFPEDEVVVIVIDDGGNTYRSVIKTLETLSGRGERIAHGRWGYTWYTLRLYVDAIGSRGTLSRIEDQAPP